MAFLHRCTYVYVIHTEKTLFMWIHIYHLHWLHVQFHFIMRMSSTNYKTQPNGIFILISYCYEKTKSSFSHLVLIYFFLRVNTNIRTRTFPSAVSTLCNQVYPVIIFFTLPTSHTTRVKAIYDTVTHYLHICDDTSSHTCKVRYVSSW